MVVAVGDDRSLTHVRATARRWQCLHVFSHSLYYDAHTCQANNPRCSPVLRDKTSGGPSMMASSTAICQVPLTSESDRFMLQSHVKSTHSNRMKKARAVATCSGSMRLV